MKKLLLILTMLVVSCTFASAELTDDLAFYASLDSSATPEVSGLNPDFRGTNPNNVGECKLGGCFDMEEDIINYGFGLDATFEGSYAYSFWYNADKLKDYDILLTNDGWSGHGWNGISYGNVRQDTQYNRTLAQRGTQDYSTANYFDSPNSIGMWHHVAVSYDYSTGIQKVYVDGNLVSTKDMGKADLVYSGNVAHYGFLLGGYIYYGSVYVSHSLDGRIDEIGVWDRPISESEVAQLYNNGNGFNPLGGEEEVPEFGVIGSLAVLAGAGLYMRRKSKAI